MKLMAVSGVIWVTMCCFWDATFWHIPRLIEQGFVPRLDVAYEYMYKIGYRLVIGFSGTLFWFSLFEVISDKVNTSHIGDRLARYGKETLGIYILQTFILETILAQYLPIDSVESFWLEFVFAPVVSIIVLILCLIIISLIEKSKYASFFCLGRPLK